MMAVVVESFQLVPVLKQYKTLIGVCYIANPAYKIYDGFISRSTIVDMKKNIHADKSKTIHTFTLFAYHLHYLFLYFLPLCLLCITFVHIVCLCVCLCLC